MAVAKFFGEERTPDAVYAVYLRKVRYVAPSGYENIPRYRSIDPDNQLLDTSDSTEDHLQWETIRERVIRAGSIEKLVECLIGGDGVMDSRHFNVFFATYRAFSNCPMVLDLLLNRFEAFDDESSVSGSAEGIAEQNSIRSVILCWMDMYPEDFYEPNTDFVSLLRLSEFARVHKIADIRSKARRLRETYKKVAAEGGLIAQIPSMDQYVFNNGYDPNDYINCCERAKMFDVGKENCVQIAEQLTFWDAELFKELLPQQCQGCVWTRRRKKGPEAVYSVRATIDQFNAVSQRVMTSIVLPECRAEFRAKIISKWIDIARELRALKNFSSLKAVLSALQSEPVYRLKSAWALVPNGSMAQFHELASIFEIDDDGEEHRARRILDEEGTAKSSPLRRPQLIQNCRRTKSDVNLAESQGTVPYLGSFLTDLAMIDQAHQDFTEDGLINFEKRRKEFEVIAKIRLFQSASRAYSIPMDPAFCSWFYFLPALDENHCFARSLEVERPLAASSESKSKLLLNPATKINTLSRIFASMNADESNNESSIGGQLSNDSGIATEDSWTCDGGGRPSAEKCIATSVYPFGMHCSRSFTAPSTPASTVSWKGGSEFAPGAVFSHQRTPSGSSSKHPSESISRSSITTNYCANGSLSRRVASASDAMSSEADHIDSSKRRALTNGHTSNSSPGMHSSPGQQPPPFYLARVALDDTLQTETAATNYKCIKVENGDRMSGLIDRVLEKHLISGDHSDYCLVQLLPDGCEFRLPDKCNPYYAVAPDPSSPMLSFVLRRRSEADGRSGITSVAPSAKKLNRIKRSNLLRWSSGYL
uniref:Ral guanine nucleotide dissociation stimulator-like 1 n=4 Tax=Parascaris univalens TaxID=6257 RepID=A0A914ZFC8_PARUN